MSQIDVTGNQRRLVDSLDARHKILCKHLARELAQLAVISIDERKREIDEAHKALKKQRRVLAKLLEDRETPKNSGVRHG